MFILVFFLASNLKIVIIRLGVKTLELVTLAAFTTQMSQFTTVVTALFVTLWAITSHMSRNIAVTTKGRIVSRTISAFHAVSGKMSYLVTVVTSRTATTTTHSTTSHSTFCTFIWAFSSQMSCFTAVVTWWFTSRLRTVTSYMTNTITSVTSVFVLAVTGNMSTAIALITICFTITTSATNSTASATSAECGTAYRTTVTAIPGKMTRSVAPIAHNSSTHDCIWSLLRKKQTKNYKKN